MHGRRNRSVTAFTAALTLVVVAGAAALGAGAFPEPLEPPTSGLRAAAASSPLIPAPGLVLATGSTDEVRYYDSAGTKTAQTQALIAGRKCDLDTDNSLLSITGFVGGGTTDKASYYADSIGVAEKTSGTSCSQVGSATSERLVLQVNPGLKGAVFPLLMTGARLDVELKQSARIIADATLGDDPDPVWTFDVQSGASIGGEKPAYAGNQYNVVDDCLTAADSGPDSKSGDNCLWTLQATDAEGNPVPIAFDTLTLRAEVGDFSLEGGGDWLVPENNRSVFFLEEVNDGNLCVGDQISLTGEGSTPDATVTRLGDAVGSSAGCVPYRFTNGTQKAELLKPLNQSESAQFVFDFVWTVPADTTLGDTVDDGLVRRTTVDFDGNGTADDETVLTSCPDLTLTTVAVDGVPTEFEVVSGMPNNTNAQDLAPGYPAEGETKQFACIVRQSIDPIIGSNDVRVTERIYAYGDILMRKP